MRPTRIISWGIVVQALALGTGLSALAFLPWALALRLITDASQLFLLVILSEAKDLLLLADLPCE
jgi:hypothetical protein